MICDLGRLARLVMPMGDEGSDARELSIKAHYLACYYISTSDDAPAPEFKMTTACSGCEDLERKAEMVGILVEGIGGAFDGDWTVATVKELVRRAICYVEGDEDMWGGHEPGESIVLAVLERVAADKARIADLEGLYGAQLTRSRPPGHSRPLDLRPETGGGSC